MQLLRAGVYYSSGFNRMKAINAMQPQFSLLSFPNFFISHLHLKNCLTDTRMPSLFYRNLGRNAIFLVDNIIFHEALIESKANHPFIIPSYKQIHEFNRFLFYKTAHQSSVLFNFYVRQKQLYKICSLAHRINFFETKLEL